MKKPFVLYLLVLFGVASGRAQTDSLDLLSMLGANESVALLPGKMLFTQRLLWGEKGLMRTSGIAPLETKGRENELKIRRTMLVTHQVLGFASLAGMIAQGIVGSRLYQGEYRLRDLHKGLGAAVNITYFTTAGMSLFTPPPLISREVRGLNSMKIHKSLAVVHLSAMVATNLLAERAKDPDIKPIHRAAAFTAFGSFLGAMVVMKF